jgi:hypothetical protein
MLSVNPDSRLANQLMPKQEECHHGKRHEKQTGVDALGRQPRNQQRQQQQGRQDECQIDPPSFGLRIEAVNELDEFRLHVGPARANGVSGVIEARAAIGAAPDRVDQQEPDRRHDGEPQQQQACERQQSVGRRVEQPGTQKPDKTGGPDRRGALGNEFPTNERTCGKLTHQPRLRLIRQP